MPDPNEPRLMTPRGNGTRKPDFNDASGNAGADGFTVVARRNPPNQDAGGSSYPMFGGTSTTIDPPVGQRDFGRGPRFSEDY